jgi:hypothetical protein
MTRDHGPGLHGRQARALFVLIVGSGVYLSCRSGIVFAAVTVGDDVFPELCLAV